MNNGKIKIPVEIPDEIIEQLLAEAEKRQITIEELIEILLVDYITAVNGFEFSEQ